MRKTLTALLLGLALTACDDKISQPRLEALTAQQVADARSAASQVIGKTGRALFVCGQADGVGMFSLAWDEGLRPDGMKDGRLVFVIREDGRKDLFFRDASGAYSSSLDDGGVVTRLDNKNPEIESWIVAYPSTGVTETHNIIRLSSGQMVDLWTSNKPTSIIGSSAKLFKSSCVRA